MENTHHKPATHITSIIIAIILLIVSIVSILRIISLRDVVAENDIRITSIQENANQTITELEQTISNLELDRDTLQERLHEEEERNDDFEDQINEISGTVTVLDKLAKTDEELLQKYSKVYFLNEHYVPQTLKNIDDKFLVSEERQLQFHGQAYPFLEDLLEEAEDDGLDLRVTSAFRSFGTQSSLKESYRVTYGAGTANQFSADQGFSEHQLGTAVDFTTPEIAGAFNAFGQTEEFEWLKDNAYKYGFVLSYPEDNTYYIYEPWHWRFVGKDLARYLDRKDIGFYDLDQRTINEYLVDLFD